MKVPKDFACHRLSPIVFYTMTAKQKLTKQEFNSFHRNNGDAPLACDQDREIHSNFKMSSPLRFIYIYISCAFFRGTNSIPWVCGLLMNY